MPGPPPPDEKESLKSLQRYEILDTAPEREFDGITLLALVFILGGTMSRLKKR
jgi:hypothetical protein